MAPCRAQLEGVAAEPGTGVEHHVAGLHAELVETDRHATYSRPLLRSLAMLAGIARHLAVLIDGELGAVLPAPPLDHPGAAGGADAGPQLGVRRGRAVMAATSAVDIAGLALQHGVVVAAGHLGQRSTIGGDQADAGRHRLDGRQAEAFVQAGHDRHLRLGVQLDDALVGYTADELDVRAQAELVDQVVARAFAWLADDRQRDVALGAQLGHRLEQVATDPSGRRRPRRW